MTKEERDEMKGAIKDIRKDWFDFVEGVEQQAKLLKIKHNALIKSGFTKEEALEIIKSRGLS